MRPASRAVGVAHDRRGVALMLVLWVIIVLGVIAAGVVTASRSQLAYVGTMRSRTIARYAAESGVVATTTRLKELLRAASTQEEQGEAFRQFEARVASAGEQAFGAARYQVAVADLNARVDLNNSSEAVLLGLFEQLFEERGARPLLDALRDWVDEDEEALPGGAEAADYARSGSPFRPPNGPIRRLDELTRIHGFTDSIATVLAPYITVRGDGRLNVNSAPLLVLSAAPELGRSGAEALMAAREQDRVMASRVAVSSLLAESRGQPGGQLSNLTTVPGHILVVSRGWEEGRPLTHEIQAVFQVFGLSREGGPDLLLRYWTERDL